MLKAVFVTVAVLAVSAAPLASQKPDSPAGESVTITGRVVDVSCFLALGRSGTEHKQCATACGRSGVPLAILGTDGTLYMPVSAKPADAQNPRLTPFAEAPVKVTGTHRMHAGMHTIEIKTIEAAS
ncbi:MAG TPA: hypothetical protein VN908_12360 [Gemmatimonadales bacterium]|nr:hypothetical protein [Gemmatimonadales bacterium]